MSVQGLCIKCRMWQPDLAQHIRLFHFGAECKVCEKCKTPFQTAFKLKRHQLKCKAEVVPTRRQRNDSFIKETRTDNFEVAMEVIQSLEDKELIKEILSTRTGFDKSLLADKEFQKALADLNTLPAEGFNRKFQIYWF